MTTQAVPLYVPLSSFNATYFQVVADPNGNDQLLFTGDSQGSFKAFPYSSKNSNPNEIAAAIFPVSSSFAEVPKPAKTEEKQQVSPSLEEKVEGEETKKEEEKLEDFIITGPGKYTMSQMPLPPTTAVYLIINLQRSFLATQEEYGVGLVYEYYAVNDYPPPADFAWDAYFLPIEFTSDGDAYYDQSFNTYKLSPFRHLYFEFEINPDPKSQYTLKK